ncbi:hypothetical protein PAENIP36_09170 [Paenibacillus sp. P36]
MFFYMVWRYNVSGKDGNRHTNGFFADSCANQGSRGLNLCVENRIYALFFIITWW